MMRKSMSHKITLKTGEALPGVYEGVICLLDDLNVSKILDAPSGIGILSEILKGKGYDVIAMDIVKNKYFPQDNNNKIIITDLNYGIPLMDQSVEAIVSVEGIEHFENSSKTIKEFYRVLKTDGYLILTTPNVANLRSRIKFLIRGEMFWFDEMAISRFGHIAPQFPFILEYFISTTGFRILKIAGNNRLRLFNIAMWMIYSFFWIFKKYRMNSMKYINSETLLYLLKK